MASEYQRFVGNYMKGRASSDFRANSVLMSEAAAAWRTRKGGGESAGARRRRNPGGSDRPVRRNPGGISGTTLLVAGVAAYALIPAVRTLVNQAMGQLAHAGTVATAS